VADADPSVVIFGVANPLGALWTLAALRSTGVPTGSTTVADPTSARAWTTRPRTEPA